MADTENKDVKPLDQAPAEPPPAAPAAAPEAVADKAAEAQAKPAAKKPAARKPAAKKPAAKKPATAKAEVKKAEAKKAGEVAAPAAAKPAARKAAAKKTAEKKPAAAKATARRKAAEAAAKKPAVKKAAAALAKELNLNSSAYYTNRELSWLEFNRRVLETAMEPDRPLLDQVKFLSIFYTNLDEFFMVRVANIFKQYQSNAGATGPDKMPPAKQLQEIRKVAQKLVNTASDHWIKSIRPALAKAGVRVTHFADLSEEQKAFLLAKFEREIYPILTPQAIDPGHPFPRISNVSINFLIELAGPDGRRRYARLRVPSNIPRFNKIPRKIDPNFNGIGNDKDCDVVLSEEIISEYLPMLFSGYSVVGKGLFRITRNTDVEIEEDEADDLLQAVRDFVSRRQFGGVVRLETSYDMPENLLDFLVEKLDLRPIQIYRVKGPMAFSGFMSLLDFNAPGLKESSYHASHNPDCMPPEQIFDNITKKDILLYHPYQTFGSVVDFVQQAARDPHVAGIKMTLYRVGNNSPIVKALMDARRNGKQVTAVVELKARFDEERNMGWAEEMEKIGVNVVYGFVGLKVHAKLCLVVRREDGGIKSYVHIGTGNYNPGSAKIYTDLGLLTCDPQITADVMGLFNVMTGYAVRDKYERLLVSPNTLRPGLERNIRAEIERHKAEGNGRIIVKCNQLVDPDMIKLLYEASQAGVKVDCLIRGICCLKPGIPGVSENITVRSILGKFLEHGRVYWFGPLEDPVKARCFIGSADMMGRNLDRRIEVVTPILNPVLRTRIAEDVLELQLADNARTWILDSDNHYTKLEPKSAKALVHSQRLTCKKYKEK